ncbi:MAG: penicillin-binding protein 1C [Deltaproteobacteria bacterium]|nr:MAG: penicillin-binding protein 1C [Deltaproteobacteria bacterium]TMQ04816.1 MAG: penicillin-binding protein 1C [Deltaproteobacteria bacterium]
MRRAARRARWLRRALWAAAIGNAALLVLLALALVVPLPARGGGGSVAVEYRDGRPAYVFLSRDDKWRLPVALDEVDPGLVAALVALEDKRFWRHDGVDPLAIVRAAASDAVHARRVSGGSTLTMQLARLLEPRPRTLPSKLVDMFRAVQLDLRLPKREILAQYLSRTPYGGNVEGVESAAWSYFGHSARHLTPLEIATLLAVPQGPRRYAPRPASTARLRARRDAILGKLIAAGAFSAADARAALADAAATAPPDHLLRMPRQAAHAAVSLHRHHPGPRLRSTLDAGAQAIVEREVALRRAELWRKGIYSCAIVVVNHRTREVVALVGSLDFLDAAHGGQIAMFERPRSPGSTLKPLLYALAIDRGMALPEYLVADVPAQYGTYRPRNFDGDWSGLVTLRDALSRSLNLPFVDLLDRFGVESFLGELGRIGVAPSRAVPGLYGLSMIVGGIELTPLELAAVYATLAEDGVYRPLRLVAGAEDPAGATLFGAGAAWLTRQALALKDRPDFPRRRDVAGLPPAIHWKTGTSFGFRDAWAVGSGPAYTAVVWTGNVDGKPSAELVGSEAAGPLLFDVLEGLAGRTAAAPTPPPGDLTEVEICSYSGHIAGAACPERVKARAPIHAVPTVPCPYHQAYDVDLATGRAVMPACRKAGHRYERRTFVALPSAVAAWLTGRHRAVPDGPVFDADCAAEALGAPPVMVTPGEGQVVTLIAGMPASRQLVPLSASTRSATLSWFVDGALVGTAASDERVYWTPTAGRHEIVAADDAGRKAHRILVVEAGAAQHRR